MHTAILIRVADLNFRYAHSLSAIALLKNRDLVLWLILLLLVQLYQFNCTFSSLPLGFIGRIGKFVFICVGFLWRHNIVDDRYRDCFDISKLVCFCVL